MSTSMRQKRRPFGSIDGNARISEKRSSGEGDVRKSKSKSGAEVVPRLSSQPSHATNTNLKQSIRETNPISQRFDIKKSVEQRRDSKTPKMSNLSATGGAYDVGNLRDLCQPRREGGKDGKREPAKDASQHGLDPSPLKLPDPIASSLSPSNKSLKPAKQRQHSKSKPRDDDGRTDGFVSASLKRLFPAKDEQTAKSLLNTPFISAKNAPCVNNWSSANLDSSTKGDDEANGVDANWGLDKKQRISRINLQQKGATDHIVSARFDFQPPRNGRTQPIMTTQERHNQLATSDLNTILNRARSGPTDNKQLLDAMLTSGCGRRTLGPDPTVHEASILESFVIGSIIGGTSLKRSNSADESEVTTLNYTVDSPQASMTTCFDHGLSGRDCIVAPHRTASDIMPSSTGNHVRGVKPSIFRTSAPPPPTSHGSYLYQEIHRASAITEPRQPNEHNNMLMFQPQLPSGWKERWSNTKQKPYWVHPDFGSTWHCPGLIVNDGHETRRNEEEFNADMSVRTRQLNTLHCQNGNMTQSTIPAESSISIVRLNADNTIQTSHDTHPVEQFAQDVPTTLSRGANGCETYSVEARQSRMATSAQVSGWNSTCNIVDSDFSIKPNPSQCLDGSSADVSSNCLTQEFETKLDESTVNDNEAETEVNTGNDEIEYDHDYASLREFNEEDDGIDVKFGTADHDDIGGQILGTVADEKSDVNDEEDTEVNAVVKHSRAKYASPLSTINEFHRGSACQSSEVSLDDDSSISGYRDGSNVPIFSPKPSFEDSVVCCSNDRSAPDDVENTRFDDAEMSPDNWESSNLGGFDANDLDTEPKKKSNIASSLSRGRKKKSFFPPGPLCSLQFLEEIENKEFDTPLWRRMKRKRSTLSSVKAQKSKQRQKQRRNTLY